MNIFNTIKKSLGIWEPIGNQSFTTWANGWLQWRGRGELLKEYRGLVYANITAITDEVAQYQPLIVGYDAKGMRQTTRNHELIKLIENPSPNLSQFELFEQTQSFIELTGEAFWYLPLGKRDGKPQEIINLRPDKMEVAHSKGEVIGYVLVKDGGVKVPFKVEEIIHIKRYNPFDSYRGLGTIQAGMLYIDTEWATSLFQRNFLKHNASPSGVLTLKNKISREAFNKIKKQWKASHGGVDNAGKTLFVREIDAEFTKVGLALNDLDLTALTKINDEKISKMFRVPKALLGQTDSTGLGRANVEAIEYVFAKRTIKPKLIRIDDALTLMLHRYWKEDANLRVEHVSQVPADEVALLNEYDKGIDRWITRNEIRKEKGLLPVEGGDKLFVPFNQVSLNNIDNQQTKDVGHTHNKKADKKEVLTLKKKGQESFFNALDVVENSAIKGYNKTFVSILEKQRKEVLDIIANNKGKSVKKQSVMFESGNFTMFFSIDELKLIIKSLFTAYEKSGKLTLEFLGKPDDEFVLEQARRDAIFNSTDRLMKSFNEETSIKIQQQLAQALAEGETPEQIQGRIEAIYDDAKGYRALRIADTESHKAVNAASAEVYKAQGYRNMKWVAERDACEYCKAMDGTITQIGVSFVPVGGTVNGQDGGEFLNDYADVNNADLHPFCKCKLLPVK